MNLTIVDRWMRRWIRPEPLKLIKFGCSEKLLYWSTGIAACYDQFLHFTLGADL